MKADELLVAYDAGRTCHVETRVIPGAFHPRTGAPLTEDVLVIDAEAQHEGAWRPIVSVGTDLGDDERPIFLDLDSPAERLLIAQGDRIDDVEVRGLNP